MRQEAERVGMDLGDLVLVRRVGRRGLALAVLQLVGLPLFEVGVSGAAAGEDRRVGPDVDCRTREGLHGVADGVGAVT